ncbi:hypothetical protein DXV75_07275 [Alteromonas aestuariivivens]|uniref:DUF2384 domain-containing protein n=1 Tax=Alteromonas aestuariivivens TaxID=1938339 RepID=A0A3D8MA03_9ALTE|nr:hypothetical protein [Alteromonas aestuariivivens]RDV26781.1 hypothetical protein DXV75_07275 [Alteromonas aestuariivivens]
MTIANNPPAVVMKAFTWAYEELSLTCSEAALMLGISEQALRQTALVGFSCDSEESKQQLAFIRLYHQLYALCDGDTDTMTQWFHQYQEDIKGVPKHLCINIKGIRTLSDYLSNRSELGNVESLQGNFVQPGGAFQQLVAR